MVSAATRRWAVLGVATLAAIVWGAWRSDPAALPGVLGTVALVAAVVAWLASRRWEVDAEAGTVTVSHLRGLRRTVQVAQTDWVHVVDAGMGVANLELMPARGRTVRLGLLRVNPVVEGSREPAVLWTLADLLERHAPDPERWPEVLRRQAAHLVEGGDVEDSPLALVTTRGRARSGPGTSSAAVLDALAERDREAGSEEDR